jgi:hypothetical protein
MALFGFDRQIKGQGGGFGFFRNPIFLFAVLRLER